jgi:hypothetical protein
MYLCEKYAGFYLPSGVRVPQDISLGKVTMGREDDNIEHHWDCTKELLKRGRVRGLKKVEEQVKGLLRTLGAITPTLLQTKFLEPVFVQSEEQSINNISDQEHTQVLIMTYKITRVTKQNPIISTCGGSPSMGCLLEDQTDAPQPSSELLGEHRDCGFCRSSS